MYFNVKKTFFYNDKNLNKNLLINRDLNNKNIVKLDTKLFQVVFKYKLLYLTSKYCLEILNTKISDFTVFMYIIHV